MDVFQVRDKVIDDYREFTTSAIDIKDPILKQYYQDELDADRQWPETGKPALPSVAAQRPHERKSTPAMHFAPPDHWLNDPNGLVHHEGRYHLFYQYNPYAPLHGNMSWGHALSTDLVAWEHLPVALWSGDEHEVYSGSVVVDAVGVSGYGTPGRPSLLAFYTAHHRETRRETQCVAVSLDGGLTWSQHPGNPVLDRGSTDFRDPKVLRWRGPVGADSWVMVAVEAVRREVHLFGSDDLLTWTPLSVFGPEGAVEGVWECPDLFPLTVDATGEQFWVMLVSMYPGGVAGGSGTQYFVGHFDGTVFTPLRRPQATDIAWLDHGPDHYAGVTFFGLPDDERTLIGWMSNWDYAAKLPPLDGTRGQMTIPRRLRLTPDAVGQPVLAQEPVLPALTWAQRSPTTEVWPAFGSLVGPCVVDVGLCLGEGARAGIRLRAREDGTGGVRVYVTEDAVGVDRTEVAGGVPGFAGVFEAPRTLGGPDAALRIVLDERSIEVFADGGATVVTALFLPEPGALGGSVTAESGAVSVESLSVGTPARGCLGE